MSDAVEAGVEILAVNMTAAALVVSMADWDSYFSDPGNIVSLIVSICAVGFTIVRSTHYFLLIKDRSEARSKARKTRKP
jgi:hypothetical protein